MPPDEEDPVIASYDVFISTPTTTQPQKTAPKFYVLQYPSHRPKVKPYSTSRSQKPTTFRQRPNTGIIEVDVPILTSDNYNQPLGDQFGRAMHESNINHPTTSHGLSGGFSQNQTSNIPLNLSDIPQHGFTDTALRNQTIGGKISTSTDKDPIYMLATLRQQTRELHLQHLDAVVQLRPQLHHIDAADEMKKRAETATTRAKTVVDPTAPIKLETKAIEMKLRDANRDDPRDRNINRNPQLLRDIQNDPWQNYEWIENVGGSPTPSPSSFGNGNGSGINEANRPQLKATLDNDEWLNKMSSPGIELRTRLKGRDRERARRKRQERARAIRAGVEATTTGGGAGQTISAAAGIGIGAGAGARAEIGAAQGTIGDITASDSSASEDEDRNANVNTGDTTADRDGDGDVVDTTNIDTNGGGSRDTQTAPQTDENRHVSPEVQIKQESAPSVPESTAPTTLPLPSTSQPQSSSIPVTTAPTPAPKRRGRPPKARS